MLKCLPADCQIISVFWHHVTTYNLQQSDHMHEIHKRRSAGVQKASWSPAEAWDLNPIFFVHKWRVGANNWGHKFAYEL